MPSMALWIYMAYTVMYKVTIGPSSNHSHKRTGGNPFYIPDGITLEYQDLAMEAGMYYMFAKTTTTHLLNHTLIRLKSYQQEG